MSTKIQTGFNNPVLREKSKIITVFNNEIKKLSKQLINTLKAEKNGIGLAAPQIGINTRIIACKFYKDKIIILCNPIIVFKSLETITCEEGCLSLPNVFGKVKRFKTVTVKYQDIKGKLVQLSLEDLPARVLQHEIDHLDGVLFVDKAEGELIKEE